MQKKKWTPSEIAQKSRTGFVSLVKRSFFNNILQVVSSLVLAKHLLQSDFAVFGFLNGWIVALIYFTDIGIGDYISQKNEQASEEDLSFYFFTRVVLTSIVTLIFYGALPHLIAHYEINIIYQNYLYLLPLLIPLEVIGASAKVKLLINLEFEKTSKLDLYSSVVLYIVQITCAVIGLGVWSFFISAFIRKSIVSVVAIFLGFPLPFPKFVGRHYLKHIKSGLYYHINTLIIATNTIILPYILSLFLENKLIGYIFWMEGLVKLAFVLTSNYNQVFFLTLAKLKDNLDAFNNMLRLSIDNILIILAFIYGLGASVSPGIVDLFFGEKWALTKYFFPQVCLYSYLFSVRYLGHSIHYSLGEPRLRTFNEISHILLTYGLVYLLVYAEGFDGYFHGMIVVNTIALGLMIATTKKWLSFASLKRLLTTGAAAIFGFFVSYTFIGLEKNLLYTSGSFTLSFFLLLYLIDRDSIDDLKKNLSKVRNNS